MTEKEAFIRMCISSAHALVVSNGLNGTLEMIPSVIAKQSIIFAEKLAEEVEENSPE